MSATLHMFLAARDLDNLLEAREQVSALGEDDQAEIVGILRAWKNTQAIANLLMYPELIPEAERAEYIVKGLHETRSPYLALAAVVGLGRLDVEALPADLKKQLLDMLFTLAQRDSTVIADRASVVLTKRLWYSSDFYTSQVVALLDHPSEVVRHNALAVLIPMASLENTSRRLAEAVQHGQLSAAGQAGAEQQLATIAGFGKDQAIDANQFALVLLRVPLLSYIPNLEDWSP